MGAQRTWIGLRTAVCLAAAALGARAQSDPLVSKLLPKLLADDSLVWAFADDGSKYSRIDFFANPPAIRNGSLSFKGKVRGGLGRSSSLLLFFNFPAPDTVTAGIATLDRRGDTLVDNLIFYRSAGQNNQINGGAEVSALAGFRDTLVIGGGRAGIALTRLGAEGQRAISAATVDFWTLPAGRDTAVKKISCQPEKPCRVDSLAWVAANLGEPDSVIALAIDSAAPDTSWLLIGTKTGLRRGRLGGNIFPAAPLPGVKAGIERIHVDSRNAILWVFTGSSYFFSDDHGRSFRKPPDVKGIATKPAAFTGFTASPQAVGSGDTTFINFNLDRPGLVLFRKDTVLSNQGGGDPADVLVESEDGLDVVQGLGRLTSLAHVRRGAQAVLAVGTTFKGIFYFKTGPGQAGSWTNINSLRQLKGSLGEIITFPTVFSGIGRDGQPEYVNIGYRLKKSGNITITIYNYAMEKVKTVVKQSHRTGGTSRSEKAGEDRWDGKDESGRFVSVGTYYVLVESDGGERGWGKVISARGR